jgi:hypothetical protein
LFTGKPPSNPTRVSLGKDKDGKEVSSNLFFSGGPNDVVNLINNVMDYGAVAGVAQSLGAKAAPAIRYAIQALTNRDWSGKKIVPKDAGMVAGTVRSLWHALKTLGPVPFSITTPITMALDGKEEDPAEYFLALAFAARFTHKAPAGTREVMSGTRKGLIVPATERQEVSLWDRITGNRMTMPTVSQFRRMSLDAAISAYESADEKTRESYRPILQLKTMYLGKYANPDVRKDLRDRLEELGIIHATGELPPPPQ